MKYSLTALAMAAGLTAPSLAQGVDPSSATVETGDAYRFISVFEAAEGAPSAEALQAGYLDPGSNAVEIFTPNRIQNADNLAARIAANPGLYRRAIDVCLPIAETMTPELRTIYANMHALLPDQELPEIHVLFGAGNSGGTAGPGAQVLGLEVICAVKESEDEIRQAFRMFFAHETVHTFQTRPEDSLMGADPLLVASLAEGVPDFIAAQVTGEVPWAERDAWARENADMLWARFAEDREIIRAGYDSNAAGNPFSDEAAAAAGRWLGNYGNAPEGWYYEAGYWIGRQIAQAYYDNAADKAAALDALIALDDPAGILEGSGLTGLASGH